MRGYDMKRGNRTRMRVIHTLRGAAIASVAAGAFLTACGSSSDGHDLYAKGIAHYEKKELDRAAGYFEQVRSMDGSFAGAGIMLAKVRYFTGKRKEAREILGDLLARDPSHTGALYWMARALVADAAGSDAEKNESQAIEYLKRALEIDGHHVQARTLLALLYEKKKMYRESLYEYKAALQEEESLVAARANLGILYKRLGLQDRASGEITKAVKIAEAAGLSVTSLAAIKKEIEGQ